MGRRLGHELYRTKTREASEPKLVRRHYFYPNLNRSANYPNHSYINEKVLSKDTPQLTSVTSSRHIVRF